MFLLTGVESMTFCSTTELQETAKKVSTLNEADVTNILKYD